MIRVSKITDYAVVVLSCFVASVKGEIWNATKLADRTHLPLPTVSKILKLLAKANILQSHRGVQGGYSLLHFADEITVADIVRAIDGPFTLTECVDVETSECGVESVCSMRGGWDKLNTNVQKAFETVTLLEISAPVDFITGYDD